MGSDDDEARKTAHHHECGLIALIANLWSPIVRSVGRLKCDNDDVYYVIRE